jgi:hypothetical protein
MHRSPVALRRRLSAGFALSSALQGCGRGSATYVSKNHSTHPVQQLRSRQGLGSKRSDCNCCDGSAIFVESEHPPNGECPGKCPRPVPRVYLRKPRAKNVIGLRAGSLEWRDLDPASRVCLRRSSVSPPREQGCQPGLEWTLSTRAERLFRTKRLFSSWGMPERGGPLVRVAMERPREYGPSRFH